MADEGQAPPPPPPPKPAAPAPPAPPAPPKPAAPAPPAPPAPPKPDPKKAPPNAEPKGEPRRKRRPAPKGRPKGKRRPAPKKGKPGQPPIGSRKGGRIKIKLGLRAKKLSDQTDEYTDQIGWTTSGSETALSDLKSIEEVAKKEPETLTHHCSMCGSRMEIPRPKRERYKVICAHPECGHQDQIGF